jgi:hypothetical protein
VADVQSGPSLTPPPTIRIKKNSSPSGEQYEHKNLDTFGKKAAIKTAGDGQDMKITLEGPTAVSSGMWRSVVRQKFKDVLE